jgi:hypothetical protein
VPEHGRDRPGDLTAGCETCVDRRLGQAQPCFPSRVAVETVRISAMR